MKYTFLVATFEIHVVIDVVTADEIALTTAELDVPMVLNVVSFLNYNTYHTFQRNTHNRN